MDFRKASQGEIDPRDVLPLVFVAVVVLTIGYVLVNSFYTVDANEQAVVLRFGKYSSTATPGLHFCIPVVDRVLKVSVEEHQLRLPSTGLGSERDPRISEEETLMLTGDLNAASVEWSVQWQVSEPREYLFAFHDPGNENYIEDRVVRTAAQTVMNRLVGDYSIDEVLTEKRSEIAEEARRATQLILDQYHCGVAVTDLQMQRVTPPSQVIPAFNNVNSAIQERDQLESEANKQRNELIPAANAERDKLIREAQGYADRRRAEVDGEVQALLAKYRAYREAPDVTRERLYLEAMQEILGGVGSKTIIDSSLQQVLPLLPLDQGGER